MVYAAVLAFMLVLSGCGSAALPSSGTETDVPFTPPSVVTVAAPVRVEIPALHADSTLIPLGISNGQVDTPPLERPEQAGWYTNSARPGQIGPAVLLGHVDGHGRFGIFHGLQNLRPADHIVITRADGSQVTFSVQSVEKLDKDNFPFDRVFGMVGNAELRLITCGGPFNRASGHYEDNIVVFAGLAS